MDTPFSGHYFMHKMVYLTFSPLQLANAPKILAAEVEKMHVFQKADTSN